MCRTLVPEAWDKRSASGSSELNHTSVMLKGFNFFLFKPRVNRYETDMYPAANMEYDLKESWSQDKYPSECATNEFGRENNIS